MGRKRSGRGRRSPVRRERRPSLTGTVRLTERHGFVETAEGSLKLAGRALREVMDGDVVAVSVQRGEGGKRATVESVIERAAASIVGTYAEAGPLGAVHPLDTRIKADFFILPHDRSARDAGVQVGDIVRARIVSYPSRYESGVVTVERRIGGEDAVDLGIQCVMARFDLEDGYPEEPERAASELVQDIEGALADPLRRDVRNRFSFTIDPVDARDFDDAISIERTSAGGFELGVHIADVSHYVAWGSSIDLEARRRGTSVYLADRVLPMLPERLCNDLCSLRPDEDRLAMTVDISLDARGRVQGARMYPSVIRSRVRLAYGEADRLLEAGEAAAAEDGPGSALARKLAHVAAEGADLVEVLRTADDLARLRRTVRERRGALDFDTVEVHALLDEAGRPYELTCRKRTAATSLVEEAMLLANECVAAYLTRRGVASAFRVHDAPDPDHLQGAASALVELGVIDRTLGLAISAGSQEAMRRSIDEAVGTSVFELVNALLLRAMQRAVYRPDNEGHYALGAEAYCHFTSPIRRYPDLIVHRTLKLALARERLGAREVRERAPRLAGAGREGLDAVLPALCRACSERERIADAAAHASQKVEVARYYGERIGEQYHAVISWVSEMGAFARMDDTQAEGLIHLRDLGDEWFDFDGRQLALVGSVSGRTVRPGNRVIVEVVSANPARGHLDLALVTSPRTLH